ncbi:hypothetical protein AAG906_025581 [Vitis piasezkii]
MGSCVSVHKSSESTMKLQWSTASKTTDSVLNESPVKENTVNTQQFKPQLTPSFRELGSKEEVFFDSQPWLESDCEDFFSINGDSTPHHGNTPMNQSSFRETPRLDRSHHMDKSPNSLIEPSPSDKKKLIELFRESFGDDPFVGNQDLQGIESNVANGRLKAKATIFDFLTNRGCSSERSPNKGYKPEKEKSAHSAQCCLPGLVRSLSFSDRKRRPSPAHSSCRR